MAKRVTCSYDGREFVRVGYYVNNEYDSEELAAEPPAKPASASKMNLFTPTGMGPTRRESSSWSYSEL
jgi:hypothetical protein